jgi:hypothetical protein
MRIVRGRNKKLSLPHQFNGGNTIEQTQILGLIFMEVKLL